MKKNSQAKNCHRVNIPATISSTYLMTPTNPAPRFVIKIKNQPCLNPSPRAPMVPQHQPPPKCIWANFSFDPTSLVALKSSHRNHLFRPHLQRRRPQCFIWQSVDRALLSRLNPTSKSTFARAVDPRRYLDIPQRYTGLVQNTTFDTVIRTQSRG